jgi:hypothetical protein
MLTRLENTLETFARVAADQVTQSHLQIDISQTKLSQTEFDDILSEFSQDEDEY